MGICTSSPTTTRRVGGRQASAKVIHVDGRLQEFPVPVKAGHVVSQNPSCFLSCSESMFLNSSAPRVADSEELQLGQIYFLVPLAHADNPLSLPDICSLAVKASAALAVAPIASSLPRKGLRPGCRSNIHPDWDQTIPARGNRGVKS
ncbi:uncharacterized protein [Aristolochia californica]|uniref:uncharacterized protein n=1 Tax=Aristolochia californica TaxID=171875 RepID=UPI0035D973CF